MAITPSLLVRNHFPVGGAGSVDGASITPVAGKTHIGAMITVSSAADCTHSMSGNGLTWTQIISAQQSVSGGTARLSLFQGTGTASAGQTTFDWTGTVQDAAFWSVTDFSEAPTVRNSASNSLNGAASGITVTLPAFGSGDSLAFGVIYMQNVSISDGSGFTNLFNDDFPGSGQQDAEYKVNDPTVDWSWSIVIDAGVAAAIELAPLTGPSVGMIRA